MYITTCVLPAYSVTHPNYLSAFLTLCRSVSLLSEHLEVMLEAVLEAVQEVLLQTRTLLTTFLTLLFRLHIFFLRNCIIYYSFLYGDTIYVCLYIIWCFVIGFYLATAADDSVVKLWDLRRLSNFKTITLDSNYEVKALRFDHSGTYLAVGGTDIR